NAVLARWDAHPRRQSARLTVYRNDLDPAAALALRIALGNRTSTYGGAILVVGRRSLVSRRTDRTARHYQQAQHRQGRDDLLDVPHRFSSARNTPSPRVGA